MKRAMIIFETVMIIFLKHLSLFFRKNYNYFTEKMRPKNSKQIILKC